MQTTRIIHAAGLVLLLGYLILSWIGIRAGLDSLDAYGVIRTVTERLQTGDFVMSRPPGHPLSEFWILPAVAWMADGGKSLSTETYAFYQLAGGLFCLGLFWLLLRELALTPAQRLLAATCLVFSPQFLIESSDGEEFLWGTAFILAVVLLMAKLSAGKMGRPRLGWCVAVASAVAASGYRIEFGVIALGIVFWTLLASDRNWIERFGLGVLAVVLFTLLWGPLWLSQGARTPYPNVLEPQVRLGVALYKIVFLALGAIPMAVAGVFFMQTRGPFRIWPPFGQDILRYWVPWLVVICFGIFLVYPTKVQVVFPGVAFLILLMATRAQRWLWAGFVVACLSTLLLQVDCFDHRAWVGFKVKPGLWEESLSGKPAYQGAKLAEASRLAGEGRHVFIANIWPWTFSWQAAHGAWPGVALPDGGEGVAYRVGRGIVASRAVVDQPSLLQGFVQKGYEVWIDREVYRELFMRYALTAPTPSTAVIGGVTCRIVEVGL